MVGLPDLPGFEETAQPKRPRRPWREKVRDALRGWKFGIRGHSSFSVHFFCTALVLAAAGALQCSLEQWALLLLCIGVVLTAELVNSAIETLHRGLDDLTKERTWQALDIAAGAVLMASVTAALVGLLIFGAQLWHLLARLGVIVPPFLAASLN